MYFGRYVLLDESTVVVKDIHKKQGINDDFQGIDGISNTC